MPFPKSWSHRRDRKLRRERYQAISKIGLATAGSPFAGETTLCIAYMCPWAHACQWATPRPALVGRRQCLRCFPHETRPATGLTDHAFDLLADEREHGVRLGPVTLVLLDQFRPAGPSPGLHQRRPQRPVYAGAVVAR